MQNAAIIELLAAQGIMANVAEKNIDSNLQLRHDNHSGDVHKVTTNDAGDEDEASPGTHRSSKTPPISEFALDSDLCNGKLPQVEKCQALLLRDVKQYGYGNAINFVQPIADPPT